MNRQLATVVAAVALASLPLTAQAPVATDQRDHGRLEERAKSMREHIDTGKQVQSHVRLSVRFKNGNRLVGVVKDGRFVERVDGLRFVEAQAQERGAGIRLWYTSGVRNYVFVPFADLADYQVMQRLTAQQIEQLEQEMQREEGRRAEREAEAARAAAAARSRQGAGATGEGEPATDVPPAPAQEPAGDGKAGEAPKGGKGAADAAKSEADAKKDAQVTEQQKLWFSLLQAYPPAMGWGKSRRDEIARRRVVVGAKPSEAEQRFVDQFAEWELACKHFGVDDGASAASEAATGDQTGSTTGRRKKK